MKSRYRASNGTVSRRAYLSVFFGGLVLFLLVERAYAFTDNPLYAPTVLLLGALVVPATFVTYVYARNTGWTVPLPTLGLLAAFGGVVSVVVAGLLEINKFTGGFGPALLVGMIEEFSKLIVPVVFLLLTRRRTAADGLVVGVTVGMAFAVLETMGYGFRDLQKNTGLAYLDGDLLARGFTSPALHIAYTGLACAALFKAYSARTQRAKWWAVFAGTYVVVAVLHGLWDNNSNPLISVVYAAISLGLLRFAAHWTGAVHDGTAAGKARAGATPTEPEPATVGPAAG